MPNYRGRRPYWLNQRRATSRELEPEPASGALLREVRTDDLGSRAKTLKASSCISDCTSITSYNWIDAQQPTIAIPGSPPRWTPLKKPTKLPEDSDEYHRDRNAARFPAHPMEPAVVAAMSTSSTLLDKNKIDVVTCSSVLGNLFKFTVGEDKTFRILVELVDDTVFFIRRENSPTELIPNVYGYGHTFPEHYTTWDPEAKGSTSHQRVLSYQFGQLSFLVRFEADGYIPEPGIKVHGVTSPSLTASSINKLGISPLETTTSDELHVTTAGNLVDQRLIFDLKTRSSRKKDEDTLELNLHRLWASQIHQFILARHDSGVFNDVQVLNVRNRVQDWEQGHAQQLSLLAALIHQIIDEVHKIPSGKLELRRVQGGNLELREQLPEAGNALSPSVKALWCSRVKRNNEDAVFEKNEDFEWLGGSGENFTNCSAECGYCGHCSR